MFSSTIIVSQKPLLRSACTHCEAGRLTASTKAAAERMMHRTLRPLIWPHLPTRSLPCRRCAARALLTPLAAIAKATPPPPKPIQPPPLSYLEHETTTRELVISTSSLTFLSRWSVRHVPARSSWTVTALAPSRRGSPSHCSLRTDPLSSPGTG